MTGQQKEQITKLRRTGRSYAEIGKQLGISKDTVKSFCRRNHLKAVDVSNAVTADICRECGAVIEQQPKHKRRIFCCKSCREKWWREHPEQLHRRAVYTFTCAGCGKTFSAYGNAKRKYCSHSCYISHRFKGGMPHD